MTNLFAVGIGGAIGALLRYGIAIATSSFITLENDFPLGTFIANMIGTFLMGLLYQTFQQSAGHSEPVRLFLTTGMLGALTTFSTFALEGVNLHRAGNISIGLTYIILSNICGFLLIYLGMMAVNRS